MKQNRESFDRRVEFQDIRVIVLLKRGGDSNFFCWLNNSERLFIERFKHLGNASFFLLHVGVNIEVERCGDVRMTQEHAHCFIIAILRSLKAGDLLPKYTLLLSPSLPLKTLKRVPFSSYFHFFYPAIRHLLLPKRTVFSPFCCDNLMKWNIKCVIFWLKKETKKAEERFNIVEFSMKGDIDVCQ